VRSGIRRDHGAECVRSEADVTFILSIATHDGVYQVCDRRLTWLDGAGKGVAKDHDANKMVLASGRITFAYTGLDEVLKTRTDLWLQSALGSIRSRNPVDLAAAVRDQANTDFPRIVVSDTSFLRTAFVGAGWWQRPDTGELSPLLLTISNALDVTGQSMGTSRAAFDVAQNQWGWRGSKFAISAHGVGITEGEKNAIWKLMHRVMKRSPNHAEVLYAMRRCVHFVANGHKEWVGHGQLAMCIPKTWAEQSLLTTGWGFTFGWPPSDELPSFYHRPLNANQVETYGPLAV
jgi:hypothetical protein